MITVNMEEVKQLESDLKTFAIRAFPFATKEMVNRAAFETRERIVAGMRKKMTLRNTFTTGKGLQVEQARTLRVSRQEAVVGHIAPYMEDQEFGGTKVKKGKKGVPIPTTSASGEGRGARPRRKIPRAANRLARIKLTKTSKARFKSKKQEIFVRVLLAARSSNKYVFLDTGRKQAIYRVRGRGRLDKKGRITGVKMDMVYNLSNDTAPIPRNPTFAPATKAVQKRMPEIYRKALIFQLKRQGLFKG